MPAASYSPLVAQLDRQIADMERRQIEAARKAWPPGATLQYGYSPTHETIAEDLKKQIFGLRQKRERLAAGLDDEPIEEKLPTVSPNYRTPGRLTTTDQRERAKNAVRPEASLPSLSAEDEAAFENIAKLYDPEHILARFENFLVTVLKNMGDQNRTVRLTNGHWGALITQVAHLEAKLRASLHFNRVKRTNLEQRVDTLLARVDGLDAVLRGEQKMTKTIRARRDASGQLVADVFEGDGTSMNYRGTWEQAAQYNKGDFVTDKGSMWACLASTRSRPGSSDDWQLAVKRGRDGKDAK